MSRGLIDKVLAKLVQDEMRSKLFSKSWQCPTGPSGTFVNKSELGLPNGATIKGLVVESTQSQGHVVGNAKDYDSTRIYVGLYNHYSQALSGAVEIRVFYTL